MLMLKDYKRVKYGCRCFFGSPCNDDEEDSQRSEYFTQEKILGMVVVLFWLWVSVC